MKAFRKVTGTAVPLGRSDIDTDAIIPQQWLITTSREGLGKGLFSNWRYRDDAFTPDPGFVLNEPRFARAKILVAGPNYGCGSSREHAVWAHLDFGIEAVIAESFGPIFRDNALRNGLPAITLDGAAVAQVLAQLAALPANRMTVDLERAEVTGPDGTAYRFTMDEERRRALLDGIDDISATLAHAPDIDAFHSADRIRNPYYWAPPPRD